MKLVLTSSFVLVSKLSLMIRLISTLEKPSVGWFFHLCGAAFGLLFEEMFGEPPCGGHCNAAAICGSLLQMVPPVTNQCVFPVPAEKRLFALPMCVYLEAGSFLRLLLISRKWHE